MMKIAVLLLVFLVQLAWSRSVVDPERPCKEENEFCEQGVDCCYHGYVCLQTPGHPKPKCVRASPPPDCSRENKTCDIGPFRGRQCCSDLKCTEVCVDDNPICSNSSGTSACADLDFFKKCPRKCSGECEQLCVKPPSPRTPSPRTSSPPPTCLKLHRKCRIGDNQCCPGYECREHCTEEEHPICFLNNVTRGCADLDFRKKCPRRCGGCERQCLPASNISAAKVCLTEFDECKIGDNKCCPGYKCIDYCKNEDTICSEKDAGWCKYENFRFQCPRKCGNCARCIRENAEV